MIRRDLLRASGLAGVPVARQRPSDGPQVAVWHAVECPGCGHAVMFEAGQRRNRCSVCGRVIRRGLGQ